MKPKILLIPGNGNSKVTDIWFPFVAKAFTKKGFQVVAKNMPDPKLARMNIWLPFIENELKTDENTILIGHSSGAVAIMRYLEIHKILGAVLVGACYTDLGDKDEILSGYYNKPWKWDVIRKNAKWIIQFSSNDDPYIPIKEPRFIHEKLDSEYHEYLDQGHFGEDKQKKEFPELVEFVLRKVK